MCGSRGAIMSGKVYINTMSNGSAIGCWLVCSWQYRLITSRGTPDGNMTQAHIARGEDL